MESIDAGQIKAISDAVGPTFMAFIGLTILIGVFLIPLMRRDKKEGGNSQTDLDLYQRVIVLETRLSVLWDERTKRGD